jgi:hypothetical protein
MRSAVWIFLAAAFLSLADTAQAAELDSLLKAIQTVDREGDGHRAALAAWRQLVERDASELPEILAAMDGANPLAANWLRGAVEAIADRELQATGTLPAAELEKFVLETAHAPRARRLAFEWLARVDVTAPDRLVPGLLHDPSVEFRRDAVARLLEEAAPLFDAQDFAAAKPIYEEALGGARDDDQIKLIAARLREMGEEVDLPSHFGFVMQWKLLGPFDNTDKAGYAVAYPPEEVTEIDFTATHQGKSGSVAWVDHTTADEYGRVDLNEALGKTMGAAAYAVTYFQSTGEQPVEMRIACPNAYKLWVNGELVAQAEVYHTGTWLDQYTGQVTLRPGRNAILLKVCQNEQTEEWAQDWAFQLRVCDAAGTAVLAEDRLAAAE